MNQAKSVKPLLTHIKPMKPRGDSQTFFSSLPIASAQPFQNNSKKSISSDDLPSSLRERFENTHDFEWHEETSQEKVINDISCATISDIILISPVILQEHQLLHLD